MAPARRSRRDHAQVPPQPQSTGIPAPADEQSPNDELFLDPLMGTPLSIYVEKDVDNREDVVDLIQVCSVLVLLYAFYPCTTRLWSWYACCVAPEDGLSLMSICIAFFTSFGIACTTYILIRANILTSSDYRNAAASSLKAIAVLRIF